MSLQNALASIRWFPPEYLGPDFVDDDASMSVRPSGSSLDTNGAETSSTYMVSTKSDIFMYGMTVLEVSHSASHYLPPPCSHCAILYWIYSFFFYAFEPKDNDWRETVRNHSEGPGDDDVPYAPWFTRSTRQRVDQQPSLGAPCTLLGNEACRSAWYTWGFDDVARDSLNRILALVHFLLSFLFRDLGVGNRRAWSLDWIHIMISLVYLLLAFKFVVCWWYAFSLSHCFFLPFDLQLLFISAQFYPATSIYIPSTYIYSLFFPFRYFTFHAWLRTSKSIHTRKCRSGTEEGTIRVFVYVHVYVYVYVITSILYDHHHVGILCVKKHSRAHLILIIIKRGYTVTYLELEEHGPYRLLASD